MSIHQFSVEEAVKYGVEPAILLTNIRFWLQKNKANNTHCHDGFYWTYNSAKAFSELFPYMSRQTITRHLKKLCDSGFLKQSIYNQFGYDRTFWYTIPSEFACNPSKINIAQNESSIAQNESSIAQNESSIAQNESTIPDINTDINTDINKLASKQPQPKKNQSSEIVLTDEQQACYDWAIRDEYWGEYFLKKGKAVFLARYNNNKINNVKEQFEIYLQAKKNRDAATNNDHGSTNNLGANYATQSTKTKSSRKECPADVIYREDMERLERKEREEAARRKNNGSVVASYDSHLQPQMDFGYGAISH